SLKLLLDTNVLVYDTVEDSEHHGEATEIIDRAKEIYIPSIVVHEFIWVMLRLIQTPINFTLLKVREYLEDPRTRYILEPEKVLIEALKMLEEDKENVKEINDYIILSTAIYYSLALATFDKKLKKRATERGIEVLP
ncbi:MAG: PIN domain-containing protein, partial [Ignisphaera sp.]